MCPGQHFLPQRPALTFSAPLSCVVKLCSGCPAHYAGESLHASSPGSFTLELKVTRVWVPQHLYPCAGKTRRCVFYTGSQSGRSRPVFLQSLGSHHCDHEVFIGCLLFSNSLPHSPPGIFLPSQINHLQLNLCLWSASGRAKGLLLGQSAFKRKNTVVWLPTLMEYYKGCKEHVLKPE